jgi:hypothetical protein
MKARMEEGAGNTKLPPFFFLWGYYGRRKALPTLWTGLPSY